MKIYEVKNKKKLRSMLENFKYDGIEDIQLTGLSCNDQIMSYASLGVVYIAKEKKEVLGLCGVIQLWSGVMFVWALINKKAYKYLKTILKFGRTLVNSFKYRRMHTFCVADDMKARIFLEHLVLVIEGRMKKYIGNRDYIMYAIIRQEG